MLHWGTDLEVIRMSLIGYFNDRVKRLNIFDIKLIQICAIFVALIIVKLVPGIMGFSIWWFVGLLVLSAIRPIYVFFFKGQM